MIPQFQILPPLSQTEAARQIGQGVVDSEFADIFTIEDKPLAKTESVIDPLAPNLLQVTILAMPPVTKPTAEQHALLTESSVDLLPPASTDQIASSAPSPVTTSAIDAPVSDVPELDATEIGTTPSLLKLTQIQPQARHGALSPTPAPHEHASARPPNLPMQAAADKVALATGQNLPSTTPRGHIAAEILPILPEQKEPIAVAVAAPVTEAKITSQAVPSLQQLAMTGRATTEPETVPTIKAAEEEPIQNAHDHSRKEDDATALADPNLPDPIAPDLPLSETALPDAGQTKITLIPPSFASLAQLAPSTTPPLPHAFPEAVASMIIAHAPQPESGPVEVVLNPQELGHLRFQIHHDGDQVNVILTVERPDTLDLVRRHVEQLLGDLRQAGFAEATLSFGQWQQSNSGANRQTSLLLEEQTTPTLPNSAFSPAQPWPSRADLGGQGLNLRL